MDIQGSQNNPFKNLKQEGEIKAKTKKRARGNNAGCQEIKRYCIYETRKAVNVEPGDNIKIIKKNSWKFKIVEIKDISSLLLESKLKDTF